MGKYSLVLLSIVKVLPGKKKEASFELFFAKTFFI
jgi:hypothetical protein